MKWILRVAVVILLGAVAIYFGWRWQVKREVHRRFSALRAAGLPVNWSEMNDYYPAVSDSQNAALVITQAFTLRTAFPDARAELIDSFRMPHRTERLTAEQRQLLAGYALLNTAAYAKVQEALKFPKCRYPIDLSKGGDSELPHLQPVKGLGWDIWTRASLAFNDRRDSQGTEALECLLGLARTLETEPILVSQLVRFVFVYWFEAGLENALNVGQLEEALLLRLDASLERADHPVALANALIGERAMLLPLFEIGRDERDRVISMMSESWGVTNQLPSGRGASSVKAILAMSSERERLFFLDAAEKGIQLFQQPLWSLEAGRHYASAAEEATARGFALSATVFATLTNSLDKHARAMTSARLSRTALAVEGFRLRHSVLPVSLTVLAPDYLPEVPTDPFDGKPLKYRRLDRGYVVYSVGPDGRDDGGRETPPDLKWKSGPTPEPHDLTFIVNR